MKDRVQAAVAAGHRLLGERPVDVETPGGRNRDSVRLLFAGRSVIATHRKSGRRARLEVAVLQALGRQGAPVPAVLAFEANWILQEDLGPLRLAEALARADAGHSETLLGGAITGLAAVHEAARAAGLAERIVTLGTTTNWLDGLIDTPRRIGDHLGLPAPALPVEALYRRLAVVRPSFVKWDARPGNAAVGDDQRIHWFDWEHCGCRNAADDLAWLLGDEYAPDAPAAEARLLQTYLPHFALPGGTDDTVDYLRCFGTFHMCVRLALILAKKGTGPWRAGRHGLLKDQVGVTAKRAHRTCLRAARWADDSPLIRPLTPWFRDVAGRLAAEEERPAAGSRSVSGRVALTGVSKGPGSGATGPAPRPTGGQG